MAAKENDSQENYEPQPAGDLREDNLNQFENAETDTNLSDIGSIDTEEVDDNKSSSSVDDAKHGTDVTGTTTYVQPDNQFAKQPDKPKMSKKKKLTFAGLAVLVIIVLVLLGGWFWYTSAAKVLGDATKNLFSQPMTGANISLSVSRQVNDNVTTDMKVDATVNSDKDGNYKATINIAVKDQQVDVQIPAEAVVAANGDMYIKISNTKKLLGDLLRGQSMSEEQISQIQTMFAGVIKTIDGQWIKFTQDDLNKAASQASSQDSQLACSQAVIKKYFGGDDKSGYSQLKQAYDNNSFISVKEDLGTKDINGVSSVGYALEIDEQKASTFGDAVEQTDMYKELVDCGLESDDASSNEADSESDQQPNVVEVWVSRVDHQFTEIKLAGPSGDIDNAVVVFQPIYTKQTQAIELPKDAISTEQLVQQVQQSFSQSLNGSSSSFAPRTTLQ